MPTRQSLPVEASVVVVIVADAVASVVAVTSTVAVGSVVSVALGVSVTEGVSVAAGVAMEVVSGVDDVRPRAGSGGGAANRPYVIAGGDGEGVVGVASSGVLDDYHIAHARADHNPDPDGISYMIGLDAAVTVEAENPGVTAAVAGIVILAFVSRSHGISTKANAGLSVAPADGTAHQAPIEGTDTHLGVGQRMTADDPAGTAVDAINAIIPGGTGVEDRPDGYALKRR